MRRKNIVLFILAKHSANSWNKVQVTQKNDKIFFKINTIFWIACIFDLTQRYTFLWVGNFLKNSKIPESPVEMYLLMRNLLLKMQRPTSSFPIFLFLNSNIPLVYKTYPKLSSPFSILPTIELFSRLRYVIPHESSVCMIWKVICFGR